ncbi:MAG: molecular chaperone GrpE (heat shock protein) [Oceanospirillaceae bacterium]|jgi:molecular chaperone GrpE (heat shock protein)
MNQTMQYGIIMTNSKRSKEAFEGIDTYQLIEEKDQLLTFLATWKDNNLTDQQAVEQLKVLTAKATQAPTAQAAHRLQMELLDYADNLAEKILNDNKPNYVQSFNTLNQTNNFT